MPLCKLTVFVQIPQHLWLTILDYHHYEGHQPQVDFSDDERNALYGVMQDADDGESGYRAKVILLKDEGYAVPEIRMATNHNDINIRKWIHRFNEQGIKGIVSKIHIHKPIKISDEIEKKIVGIATKKIIASTPTLSPLLINLIYVNSCVKDGLCLCVN